MADVVFAPAAEARVLAEPAAVLSTGGVVTDDGWRAYVTMIDGTVVTELTDCVLGQISEKLNAVPTFTLTVPKASAAAADLERVTTEVQVYRNGGNPLFVGPLLQRSASAGDGAMGMSCAGVGWYLTRRYGSKFDTGNLLLNHDFGNGLDRWTISGDTSLSTVHETGTHSALIQSSGQLRQKVSFTSKGRYRAVVEARVKITAGGGSGSWTLDVGSSEMAGVHGSAVIAPSSFETEWQTFNAYCDVAEPSNPSGLTVQITGGSSGSDLLIDRMYLFVYGYGSDDPMATDPYTVAGDQTTAIRQLIQDRNLGLNLGVYAPTTDQLVLWEPVTDAQQDTLTVVDRYVKRDNGVEWSIEATPTTRTFTVYYPQKGRVIPPEEVTLRLVADGDEPRNVTAYSLAEDATKAVSHMTTFGDGPFHGVAFDENAWGGLVLQQHQQAPAGTDRQDLVGLSRRALRASIGETQALSVDVSDGDLIDVIRLGDSVSVVIDDWDVHVDGVFRVVGRELRCNADAMTLELNPVVE